MSLPAIGAVLAIIGVPLCWAQVIARPVYSPIARQLSIVGTVIAGIGMILILTGIF